MSATTRINVTADGRVLRPGIETPKGTKVVKHDKVRQVLTIKIPGHKVWVGLNVPYRYAPAEYEVYKITEGNFDTDGNDRASYRVEFLTAFPVKS